MAHEKVYGFCENKCKVEVSPKTEVDAFDSRIKVCEDVLENGKIEGIRGYDAAGVTEITNTYIPERVFLKTTSTSGKTGSNTSSTITWRDSKLNSLKDIPLILRLHTYGSTGTVYAYKNGTLLGSNNINGGNGVHRIYDKKIIITLNDGDTLYVKHSHTSNFPNESNGSNTWTYAELVIGGMYI